MKMKNDQKRIHRSVDMPWKTKGTSSKKTLGATKVQDSRVWRNSDVVRPKPPIKSQQPLFLGNFLKTIHHRSIR